MFNKHIILTFGTLFIAQVALCIDPEVQWERVQYWTNRFISDMEESIKGLEAAVKAVSSSESCASAVKDAQSLLSDEQAFLKKVQAAKKEAQEKWDACKSAADVLSCQGDELKEAGLQVGDLAKEDANLIVKAAAVLRPLKSCKA